MSHVSVRNSKQRDSIETNLVMEWHLEVPQRDWQLIRAQFKSSQLESTGTKVLS